MARKRTQAQEQQLEQQESVATREPGQDVEPDSVSPLRPWKHDNRAGVERLNYMDPVKEIFEFWLRFRDGKPSDKVRDCLKDNGFHWEPTAPKGGHWPDAEGAWVLPLRLATKSQDRLHGERVFEKIVDMLLEEKGISAELVHGEGIGF